MKQFSSFNTFKEIANLSDGKKVLDFLNESYKYLAHTHKDRKPETLEEHLQLVTYYFIQIVKVHKLDKVINKLINDLIPDNFNEDKNKIGNFIKQAFYHTILYHDFGKINHLFQSEKMDNTYHNLKKVNHKIGSHHSILSSYIYLIHQLNYEPISFDDREQSFIDTIVTALSYPIIKHHSRNLLNIYDIDFKNDENIFENYLDLFKQGFPDKLDELHEIIANLKTTFKDYDYLYSKFGLNKNEFVLFTLIKINYSLLTASDYYATHHYMSNLKRPYCDFGIIDKTLRKKIFENFKIKKSHNEDLLINTYYYRNYSFEDLCEPDNDNLNILRQKLGVEVIDGIETTPNEKVFYIEAPTGGGKTNLSVIAIYQLLKQHKEINKVFYVFPFTTLITQTFKTLKETLGLKDNEIIQIHSKAGFHSKYNNEEDDPDFYSNKKKNYIDNLFINYPFCLLSHIRFFEILKTNKKETNYILHRLANSIVIIDELQSYSPSEWDKVKYFISNYAEYFNIKFILMSATLPEIHSIAVGKDIKFKHLIRYAQNNYLTNPNFKDRVCFDYTLLDKKYKNISETELSDFIYKQSEQYAISNKIYKNSVHTIVEFIFKKSSASFFNSININGLFKDYEIFVLSGTIIEPRRKYIINYLKNSKNRKKKILLITTQVVEAGVDIDMDLGFKNQSLLDSDEQLAGRINRNVLKEKSKLFLFNKDEASRIYGKDLRYEFTQKMDLTTKKEILENKNFNKLYDLVKEKINSDNKKQFTENFSDYKSKIDNLNFYEIDEDFQLINNETTSFFVPLCVPIIWKGFEDDPNFSKNEIDFLVDNRQMNKKSTVIDGEKVWELYKSIIENRNNDFVQQAINIKIINGIMSKFIFSTFSNKNLIEKMKRYCDYDEDKSNFKIYGYYYLNRYEGIYTLEGGLDESKLDSDFII